MARNKKVEILSNGQEVLHPITDGDCVIFSDGQTLAQKLSEDDSVKYTPEVTNSSPMFKVGEGNTVDYSDNVLDGAYERATLQGQTYVNYIQESSADEVTLPTPFTEYERTQHNTLTSNEEGTLGINLVGQSYVNALQHDSEEEYVVLGESLEFQEKKVEYTNEGQIKSAMLKGQTLVNLATTTNFSMTTGGSCPHFIGDRTIAPNTYTIIADITISGVGECMFAFYEYYGMTRSNTRSFTESGRYVWTENIINTKIGSYGFYALQGSSTDTTYTLNNLVILEGDHTNEDIPYFEGMQSVTVSTKLENLCQYCDTADAKIGKTFTVADASSRALSLCSVTQTPTLFKCNTKYLVQFKISNLVLDGLESVRLIFSNGVISSGNCLFGNTTHYPISANGVYSTILTSTDLIDTSTFIIKGIAEEWENSNSSLRSLTISNVMCIEYQNGMENWDLPYFEDYQVMKPVQVESVNKNLFDKDDFILNKGLAWIDGSFVTINNQGQQASESYVPINYNSTYIMSGLQNGLVVCVYDHNKNVIGFLNNDGTTIANLGNVAGTAITSFNLSNYPHSKYVRFCVRGNDSQNTQDISNIQIEESSTATTYQPHQSKTTYSWDEVILRKVGDVEDTLDLTTGEWVQRIGEITYDGNSDETWDKMDVASVPSGSNIFRIKQEDMSAGQQAEEVCNTILGTLPTIIYNTLYNQGADYDCMSTVHSFGLGVNAFYLHYKDVTTVAALRERLKANPVKVQYVLTKPIVHKVNLSRPNLQAYDDVTHIHTNCLDGTLVPNIYLPSDISYPATLEPSKKYNVCVNHTEVSADNPLKVNVGGTEITITDNRMTLTTPATLANSNVSFTGKGNKIKESMLIKSSNLLTGDLPHFNGIGSVQLGKTITNLCESKISPVGNSAMSQYKEYEEYVEITISTQGSRVITSKLLKPLKDGKKYFIYAPNDYPNAQLAYASFHETYNNVESFTRLIEPMKNKKYAIIEINQANSLYDMVVIGFHNQLPTGTYTINRPIICEYEPGMENWDWESIGYFTGTKNIGNEFMRVQNKNLFDKDEFAKRVTKLNGNNTLNGDILSYDTYTTYRKRLIDGIFKPNTRYTIKFNVTINAEDKNFILIWRYTDGTESLKSIGGNNKIGTFTLTLTSEPNKTIDYFYTSYGYGTIVSVDLSKIQLEESSTATSYTAHKENTLYVRKDQPIELTWEQGRINPSGVGDSYTNAINNTVSYGVRNKGLLNLKPNTTYRLSLGDTTTYKWHIALFDNWDCALQANNLFGLSGDWSTAPETFITTTKDYHKIGINIQRQDSGSLSASTVIPCRLEEVEEIKLRGINGICDELDITRGKYIQRITEFTLNGRQVYYKSHDTDLGTVYYVSTPNSIKNGSSDNFNFLATKLTYSTLVAVNNGILTTIVPNFKACLDGWASSLFFSLPIKDVNTSINANSLQAQAYLKENPITMQYVLETPIEHDIVFIGNKNELGAEITKPNDVFTLPTLYTEQTHIELQNNGLMPKVQSRDYIAYPVLPMINRTYTLQHNLTGGVSNLTVDLLGKTQSVSYQNHKSLVYTPETMNVLHNELRISGAGNKISKVMLLDGGYMDRDIPYIEGMKNAVNPIVKNVGKNLYHNSNSYIFNDGVYIGTKEYHKKPTFILQRNTNYTMTFESSSNDGRIYGYNDGVFIGYLGGNSGGGKTVTFNTGNCNGISFYRQVTSGLTLDYKITLSEVQTTDEYKENICYVDCGEIRLTEDMFEQGSITVHVNNIGKPYTVGLNDDKTRIRTKKPINIEPNEQYVIIGNTDKYGYSLHFLDKDENYIDVKAPYELSWGGHKPFTVASDSPKALVFIKRMDMGTITPNDVDVFNFQLVKVSEIKPLRSLPNGVYDEIDLETGTYIQRVGEITFDGSDDEQWSRNTFSNNSINERINRSIFDIQVDNASLNNDTKVATNNNKLANEQAAYLYSHSVAKALEGVGNPTERIRIAVLRDKLYSDDSIGFKQYLSQNPITVQYELAEPIVKDVVIHNYPHSYKGGHVLIENGDPNTPIPARITYRAVTNRSGQIQQHTEQVEKQEQEINELEMLILANISNQTRS